VTWLSSFFDIETLKMTTKMSENSHSKRVFGQIVAEVRGVEPLSESTLDFHLLHRYKNKAALALRFFDNCFIIYK